MKSTTRPKLLVVLGPTASGKSALAVALARKISALGGPASGLQGAEIISADSRQVYQGLDIGTGKITKAEMRGVRHHLLDVASPKKIFTVAQFQKLGRRAIRDSLRRGKVPIICGGTGLYIDTLVYGYALPAVKPNMKLRHRLEKLGVSRLFSILKRLDPVRAKTIDRHNPRRLIRALEIVIQTGKPIPALRRSSSYDVLKIGIRLPDAELKRRIHIRLLVRLRRGMVSEVRRLKRLGVSSKRLESLGLEYRYIHRYLEGTIPKRQMMGELEKEIRRYAKRQMTWFKRDKEIHWIKNRSEAERLAKIFLSL